jgi:hypothetical protein
VSSPNGTWRAPRGVHEHLRHGSREVTLSLPLDGAQFRDAQWWHEFTIAVDIEPEPRRAYELGVLGMAKLADP